MHILTIYKYSWTKAKANSWTRAGRDSHNNDRTRANKANQPSKTSHTRADGADCDTSRDTHGGPPWHVPSETEHLAHFRRRIELPCGFDCAGIVPQACHVLAALIDHVGKDENGKSQRDGYDERRRRVGPKNSKERVTTQELMRDNSSCAKRNHPWTCIKRMGNLLNLIVIFVSRTFEYRSILLDFGVSVLCWAYLCWVIILCGLSM